MSILTLILAATVSVAPGSQWPGFRGTGDSRSTAADLPLEWSADKNIAWTLDLPGRGQSSPVVVGGKVFVTSVSGENKETIHVVCADLATGKALWTKTHKAAVADKDTDYVAKASPTPAADADRVYAFFESGDLLAFDRAGELVWSRSLTADFGPFNNNHGLGCSPAQSKDALFLLVAHGPKSYLLAVDKATGKDRWRTERAMEPSWSSPIYVENGGQGLVVFSSNGEGAAFDAATGKQVWSVGGFKGNTVASATVDGDAVLVGSSEPGHSASLRLGAAEGDRVLWRTGATTCSFGSPLLHNGLAFFVNKAGVAACCDAKTGEERWSERLAGSCWASPLGAGDRVYFFTTVGVTEVWRAGPKPERLAKNELAAPDRIYGVAAVDGAILIRQSSRLICVGKPK